MSDFHQTQPTQIIFNGQLQHLFKSSITCYICPQNLKPPHRTLIPTQTTFDVSQWMPLCHFTSMLKMKTILFTVLCQMNAKLVNCSATLNCSAPPKSCKYDLRLYNVVATSTNELPHEALNCSI